MERVIDKIILYICAVYVLLVRDGSGQPFLIYLMLAGTAAMLWLIPVDKMQEKNAGIRRRAAWILLDLMALLLIFHPNLIGVLPLLIYDLILCRHWAGLFLSAAAMGNVLYRGDEENVFWYLLFFSLLAVWLCYGSEKRRQDRSRIRMLRDDAAEQQKTLSLQNEQLISAREGEVMAAQLAERNRIAREIHDNVGHTLSRALLQVGALLAIHREEPVHSELSDVRETLDSAMTSIRTSVHDLHDSSIDLKESIRQLAAPLQNDFNVRIELDVSENMPRELKYGMIAILREAVSNIMKHSRNDTVQISLMEHPGFYQLVVHDYMSPGGTRKSQPVTGKESGSPGIGLGNIESRARGMGGTTRISEGEDFRIFISVPK
ncbi:MAG: hypothetical protein IKQ49_03355 [Eubacterium sp.]|nr:hypothetical protein [Eubacterium sp.]